jgi:hypothetical protein
MVLRQAVDPTLLRSIWGDSQLLLNATEVLLGIEQAGSESRIACVRESLKSGRRVSIAAVGGSITAGMTFKTSQTVALFTYHAKIKLALDALFPPAASGGHALLNGGVPGTGPTYMEHCVHNHMPEDPDLVLLEYSVNTDHQPLSFERLLRRLLLHPRAPAILVVNAHRWRAIRSFDGRTDKCWSRKWERHVVDLRNNATQWDAQTWGDTPGAVPGRPDLGLMPRFDDALNSDEDAIASLCRHYSVPLVSIRGGTLSAVRRGALAIPSFMSDCRHPTGQGHTFLAQSALQRLLAPPPGTGSEACRPAVASLPPPLFGEDAMVPDSTSSCARGAQLPRHVSWASGFTLTDEGRGPGKIGYVATEVGASLGLCLPTLPGKSHLWIGYLRSYEHMGRAGVTCAGTCRCEPMEIDGNEIRDGVSVTDMQMLTLKERKPGVSRPLTPEWPPSATGCCALTLRVLPESTTREHKFKLMSLLLGADVSRIPRFSLRVASNAAEDLADTAGLKL